LFRYSSSSLSRPVLPCRDPRRLESRRCRSLARLGPARESVSRRGRGGFLLRTARAGHGRHGDQVQAAVHIELEPAVGGSLCPEGRGQRPPVRVRELVCPCTARPRAPGRPGRCGTRTRRRSRAAGPPAPSEPEPQLRRPPRPLTLAVGARSGRPGAAAKVRAQPLPLGTLARAELDGDHFGAHFAAAGSTTSPPPRSPGVRSPSAAAPPRAVSGPAPGSPRPACRRAGR
jgi:hypothetical protein